MNHACVFCENHLVMIPAQKTTVYLLAVELQMTRVSLFQEYSIRDSAEEDPVRQHDNFMAILDIIAE